MEEDIIVDDLLLLEEEEAEKPNMARRDTAACLAFPSGPDPSPRHSVLKIKIQAIADEDEDDHKSGSLMFGLSLVNA